MTKEELFAGKRVKVSPEATGWGEWKNGTIDKIEEFMRRQFVSVNYDSPAPNGRTGITITNLGLIEPLD